MQAFLQLELSKIKPYCKNTDLIPYNKNGNWGYMISNSKLAVTKPLFQSLTIVKDSPKAHFGDYEISFDCKGFIKSVKGIEYFVTEDETYRKRPYTTKGVRYTDYRTYSTSPNSAIAFAEINNRLSVLDMNGRNLSENGMNYKWLHFYAIEGKNKLSDTKMADYNFLIFFTDSLNRQGFLNNKFKSNYIPGLSQYFEPIYDTESETEIEAYCRKFPYLKVNGKWGIWDTDKSDWLLKPHYLQILNTSVYKRDNGNPALYFLVKDERNEYYVDQLNVKYILSPKIR